jgi:hypothetical protein
MHRSSSSRRHWITLLALVSLLSASAAATLGGAGLFTENASALASVSALENINNASVPISFSPSSTPDGSWTSVGTVALASTPYVLFASVGFRDTLVGVPASVECALTAPNEPEDLGVASFQGVRGSNQGQLSFTGVTTFPYTSDSAASLRCHTIGAGSGLIIAHDARIVAMPVDSANSNLKTGKQP